MISRQEVIATIRRGADRLADTIQTDTGADVRLELRTLADDAERFIATLSDADLQAFLQYVELVYHITDDDAIFGHYSAL
jgi:hypothetical protein